MCALFLADNTRMRPQMSSEVRSIGPGGLIEDLKPIFVLLSL